ncbi:hypothetical protein [Nocardia aurantia]|uniref:Uncharacterized protein n=1 Tax=Nocardia aurantia TaxID=2585199 RepID=A0A7K0DNL6_9NOCA|nr:hypothetical protein [Nocardia aurantia]MQY26394.1 hypothetical protein [Nocardia aurantia]
MTFGRIAVAGIVLLAGVEIVLLCCCRSLLLPVGGVGLLLVLAVLRPAADPGPRDHAETEAPTPEPIERWLARTAALLDFADSSRGDWDRHLRPVLAREFAMSLGHKAVGDRRLVAQVGTAHFGAALWPWVDPSAAAPDRRSDPGPGRGVLLEIIDRLERL